MARSTAQTPPRPLRADARRNYERLLGEARTSFARHGTDTSLEDIARRAGVGIGTLYRHFPNRQALISAVFQDALGKLVERAAELSESEEPCHALVEWLRAFVTYAGEYRGLSRALMSARDDASSPLGQCRIPMNTAGGRLLARAQEAGAVGGDVSVEDLLQLTNAIALASEQSPEDPGLADRLLMLTLTGLRPRPTAARPSCGADVPRSLGTPVPPGPPAPAVPDAGAGGRPASQAVVPHDGSEGHSAR